MRILTDMDSGRIYAFVPHSEGRGANLEAIRLRIDDYESLSPYVKERFNRSLYRTEGEWARGEVPQEEEKRLLILSLTKENVDSFEKMGYGSALRYLEELDDAYYGAIPSFAELVRLYGDADGDRFYRKRDLFRTYQKRYIAENKLTVTDVTDERYCGSRRY